MPQNATSKNKNHNLVDIRDVTFKYGARTILANLSLGIERGRVTAIMGGSGCGKTTLLNLIAGLQSPDAGRIVLGSSVLFDAKQKANVIPEEGNIGYVFQRYAGFPLLSG